MPSRSRQLLSQRATQLGEREASLVARELAVLEREERCSSQERKVNALRRGLEGERELLKLERARWEDERRGSSAMSAASVGSSSTGSSSTSTHSTAVEMDVDNTVMPRPTGSKVPRRSFTTRPLEERLCVLLYPSSPYLSLFPVLPQAIDVSCPDT